LEDYKLDSVTGGITCKGIPLTTEDIVDLLNSRQNLVFTISKLMKQLNDVKKPPERGMPMTRGG